MANRSYPFLLLAGALIGRSKREVKAKLDDEEQLHKRLTEVDRLRLNEPVEKIIERERDSRSVSSLRLLVLLHRHGDRTPLELDPRDPLAEEPFWRHHGIGKLTNRGRARMYLLGRLMRSRYASFFGDHLSKHQIVSISSGIERCIESGQLVLAGLMSSQSKAQRWDDDEPLASLWAPIAASSLVRPYDGLLSAQSACRNSGKELERMAEHELVKKLKEEFREELAVLGPGSEKISMLHNWIFGDDRLSIEHDYFADKLAPELEAIRGRISELSSRVFSTLARNNDTMRRLRVGLLVEEILDSVDKRSQGARKEEPVKLVHLSTQDAQLSFLLGTLDVWEQDERLLRRPGYGASLAFELHEDERGWFVKVLYFEQVPGEALELELAGSEPGRGCSLGQFRRLLGRDRIEAGWQQWMAECGEDIGRVDPYRAR